MMESAMNAPREAYCRVDNEVVVMLEVPEMVSGEYPRERYEARIDELVKIAQPSATTVERRGPEHNGEFWFVSATARS
jgi:hypothetical protein